MPAPTNPNRSDLDQTQIIQRAFDESTDRLRVDAEITAQSITVEVDLDYQDDSVSIGDPVTNGILTIYPNGSIDANVEVDAADGDNIAIQDADGDQLDINPDGSINVNVAGAAGVTTPVITNIAVPTANTEQSYAFPSDTKKFIMRARGNARLQIAYIALQSGTNYITVAPGNVYEEIDLNITSTTIYFQSSKSSETVEILSWS